MLKDPQALGGVPDLPPTLVAVIQEGVLLSRTYGIPERGMAVSSSYARNHSLTRLQAGG